MHELALHQHSGLGTSEHDGVQSLEMGVGFEIMVKVPVVETRKKGKAWVGEPRREGSG